MNHLKLTALIFLFCFTHAFAQKEDAVSQVRPLSNFNFIKLKSGDEVFVTQENSFGIKVVAADELIDQVTTEVSNNTLEIGTKSKGMKSGQQQARIYISLPKPNGLEVDGSGTIIMQNAVMTDFLSLSVNGSGTIKIQESTTQQLKVSMNGSGTIKHDDVITETALIELAGSGSVKGENIMCKMVSLSVSGSGAIRSQEISSSKITMTNNGSGSINQDGGMASMVIIENSGSGDIDAGNLKAASLSVINSGSGDIIIGTGEMLEAQLTGSGDIRYHTAPMNIRKDVRGSGRIGPL
jgi:hypothetical protein